MKPLTVVVWTIAALLALVFVALWINTPAHAEELPTDEVLDVAALTGVDPIDLQGAVNTVRESGIPTSARQYAVAAGELAPPPTQAAAPARPVPTVWDSVAWCESRGNWSANTGNGYFGGLQMDMAFWRNHGGLAYAPRPDLAPKWAQVQVAINGRDGLVGGQQGWPAWPHCHP